MIRLVLPWPPSVNHCYRSAVKRGHRVTYLTKEGKDYKRSVAQLVMMARSRDEAPLEPLPGRVRYTVTLFPPDRRRRDISNTIKVLEDALTTAGVWIDDEQVDELTIRRAQVAKGGRAIVEVSAMV